MLSEELLASLEGDPGIVRSFYRIYSVNSFLNDETRLPLCPPLAGPAVQLREVASIPPIQSSMSRAYR